MRQQNPPPMGSRISAKLASLLARVSLSSAISSNSGDPDNPAYRMSERSEKYRNTARLAAFPPPGASTDGQNEDQALDDYMQTDAAKLNKKMGLPEPQKPTSQVESGELGTEHAHSLEEGNTRAQQIDKQVRNSRRLLLILAIVTVISLVLAAMAFSGMFDN